MFASVADEQDGRRYGGIQQKGCGLASGPQQQRMDVTALQGALRLLFLLDRAGVAPPPGSRGQALGAVAVIEAERKLQALHFWMRNPDYLAHEILVGVESGDLQTSWLEAVEGLLDGEEPDLHRFPMLRHRFGAYEPIDDAFSYLAAAGLAVCHRSGTPGEIQRTDFFLLPMGRDAARQLIDDHVELQWYADRASIVATVGGALSGYAAKKRQYELSEYAETSLGDQIQPVADVVRARLSDLRTTS